MWQLKRQVTKPRKKKFPCSIIWYQLTDHSSSSVSHFIILALGQLHQEFGYLVLDVHLAQNGRPVVGYCHLPIGANKHLVHAIGTEGSTQSVGDYSSRKDV